MKASEVYYELTEEAYLALCPERSSHMNLGIWPAENLRVAQENLVRKTLAFAKEGLQSTPTGIIDAGSGWGGSRQFFYEYFKDVPYTGINSSANQITHALTLNQRFPKTRYLRAYIEDLPSLDLQGADTLISIEAAFHFENKAKLISDMAAQGIKNVTIADICVIDREKVFAGTYTESTLINAWSEKEYLKAFADSGYKVETVEITDSVFLGWNSHLQTLSPQSYGGRPRVLRQMVAGFLSMEDMVREKQIRYFLFRAHK